MYYFQRCGRNNIKNHRVLQFDYIRALATVFVILTHTVFISKTSYGIYLTHFMFISVFTKLPILESIPLMIEPFAMLALVMICELDLMFIINKTRLRDFLL